MHLNMMIELTTGKCAPLIKARFLNFSPNFPTQMNIS